MITTEDLVPESKLQNLLMQLRKMANHPLLHRKSVFCGLMSLMYSSRYTLDKLHSMSVSIMSEPDYMDNDAQAIFEDMEGTTNKLVGSYRRQFCRILTF